MDKQEKEMLSFLRDCYNRVQSRNVYYVDGTKVDVSQPSFTYSLLTLIGILPLPRLKNSKSKLEFL